MRCFTLVLLSVLSACSRLGAQGTGAFRTPAVIPTHVQGIVTSVAAGDFNGDRRLDLAATGAGLVSGRSGISVLLHEGGGREGWSERPLEDPGGYFIHARDLDGDGDDDLAVADPQAFPRILLSRGDGSFAAGPDLRGLSGPRWITTGDWDGDDLLDLAVAYPDGTTVQVFRGRGDGSFEPPRRHALAAQPHSIAALDYDGDGNLDLAVAADTDGLRILKGAGDGTFQVRRPSAWNARVRCVSSADCNRDGLEDVVAHCAAAGIVVFLGKGDGTIEKKFQVPDTSWAVTGNFDGDDLVDLACYRWKADSGQTQLLVLSGKGDGTFSPSPFAFALPFLDASFTPYSALVAGDLDGDGLSDLVTGDFYTRNLQVHWAGGGPIPLETPLSATGFRTTKAMAVADVDHDGFPDLVVAGATDSKMWIFLKPGVQAAAAPSSTLATQETYTFFDMAHADGDGVLDLVGTNYIRKRAMVALLDREGKVRSETVLDPGAAPYAAALGELNGDGVPDLALVLLSEHRLALHPGLGGGAFGEPTSLPTIERPTEVAIADVDRDGWSDIVALSYRSLALHRRSGAGSFHELRTVVAGTVANTFSDVAAADLDGDSWPELIVTDRAARGLLIFPATGGGEFGVRRLLTMPSQPVALAIADLDHDGLPDLTTTNTGPSSSSFSVFLSRGAGAFEAPREYPLDFQPIGHRLADLNQDGALDLVAYGSLIAAVFLGERAPPPSGKLIRGDVDLDGRVEVNDPIAILGRLFLGAGELPCQDSGDANDDGELSLTDAVVILQRLFLGGDPLPPPAACGVDPTEDALPACVRGC